MGSFLQNVREFYDNPASELGALEERYQRVLDARHRMSRCRDVLSLDLDNIEVLFGLLDMENVLFSAQDSSPSEAIKHVIAHTVERTYKRTAHLCSVRVDSKLIESLKGAQWLTGLMGEEPHEDQGGVFVEMPFYDYVVAAMAGMFEPASRQMSSTIVTFNYDTVVEQSLAAIGRGVDYGLSQVTRQLPTAWGGAASVKVLKLHGSANWSYTGARGKRGELNASYSSCPAAGVPILIPPTWRKGDVSEIMVETWSQAAEAMTNATRIVVIGYSAPVSDTHFNHLMANGLAQNPGLYSLSVVDFVARAGTTSDVQVPPVVQTYSRIFAPLHHYKRLRIHTDGLEGYFSSSGVGAPACSADRLASAVTYAGRR